MRFASWYGISIGILIIVQWIFFITTDSVPELQTTLWAIGFHIAAEGLLALALLVSGIATLQARSWGRNALLVALGMAMYSEINSPGYFAQLGQWSLVGMFAILLFGATTAVMQLLNEQIIGA
ncbi:MAG TPA: hypothetical protein VMN99_01625 [Anaerolineales bacterium]|nr:hypothetical protein [Anaerolineales bacterium]